MKTWRRPMSGAWWSRNPHYRRYMARELSSPLIVAYALVLLTGVYRLQQGAEAFQGWLDALASPGSIAFHALTLALVTYHAWTWFRIMPKTLPFLRIGAWRVPDRLIVASGIAALAFCTAAIVLLAGR